ncbi:hypothetical protein Catovirus_1_285 [Catovirus CTV1]|uniref:Uncharacterized protein n=1 Tax=Catovirus CTV1 TaxID=1977631 RepID=A0A1V0S947_9VIRU|nr:hypothetical protein Catovirus_1_285 [Catovirus CTV1]
MKSKRNSVRFLVSNDEEEYGSKYEDEYLKNGWGLQIIDDSIWLSANKSNKLIQYQLNGKKLNSVDVAVPTALIENDDKKGLGAPLLYFVTEEGKLYELNFSLQDPVRLLVDNSGDNAMYTGLTKYKNLLYATDFHNKKIDVFDILQDFAMINMSFIDLYEPNEEYTPNNIVKVEDLLYVAYAEKDPNSNHSILGKGKGYINIFTAAGTFVKRFVSNGKLNSPYGLTLKKDTILVGNYGDGKINEYSLKGKHIGTLRNHKGKKIKLEGLSTLLNYNHEIYFDSGPNSGNDGILGKIFC